MTKFYNYNENADAYFKSITSGLDNLRNNEQNSDQYYTGVNGVPSRVPWIISTTEWLENNNGIIWNCNPSDVSWSIRLRQSTTKNANSTVTHVWPNSVRGTNFDEMILNINFQSGNLIPYNRRDLNDSNINTPPGLVNFYDFLKLVDSPKLTTDGRVNHVIIKYNSNIFPKITLIGQFDPEGIRFSDSSSDPNNVSSWSATFMVLDSDPRISGNDRQFSNTTMLGNYLNNMGLRKV